MAKPKFKCRQFVLRPYRLSHFAVPTQKPLFSSPLCLIPVWLCSSTSVPVLALKLLPCFRLVFCFDVDPLLIVQPIRSLPLSSIHQDRTSHPFPVPHLGPVGLTPWDCSLLTLPTEDRILGEKQLVLTEPPLFWVKYPQILPSLC